MTDKEKKEFWKRLCKRNNWAADESVKEHYFNLIRMVLDDLRDNGVADLPEFGKFYLSDIKGFTTRHDINTGMTVPLGALKRLYFTPCKKLKEYIRRLSGRE